MSLRPILEPLLDGEFICQTSRPGLFHQLEDPDIFAQVDQVLNNMDLKLCSALTDAQIEDKASGLLSNSYFYAAYINLENERDNKEMMVQFQKVRDQIDPIVLFLHTLMKVMNRDATFIEGDCLRFNELLNVIETESAYLTELKRLAIFPLFKKNKLSEKNADILMQVLDGLKNEGYLQITNKESMIYQFTGKIMYFYNLIDFIVQHEEIAISEEGTEPQQRDLLL